MGNCVRLSLSTRDVSKKSSKSLAIETTFKLPSPIPTWPPGEGFASGTIDLGGIQVCQISSFKKVWAAQEGGADDIGATFFEPSPIPEGFFLLGFYGQSNVSPLFGCVLAAKESSGAAALKHPVDYVLVWSSESMKMKQDGHGYFWLPSPPDGYKALGLVVTNSPEKPSLDKIICVRSDLTEQCQKDAWIWGPEKTRDADGFNVYSLIPNNRGTQALSVGVGTFAAQINSSGAASPAMSLSCLKNASSNMSAMPNLTQINALVSAYSPLIYFHPDEIYLPSSVAYYFTNGALLYKKGEESKPDSIESTGSNLPQGGSNDGAYWLDLPIDEGNRERLKKGDLHNSEVYLQVKPMLGATFTDIVIWIFYPFNGPARAKVELINVPLGRIGEHVGDWEHLTLRISNFNGELKSVYFSQHSGGKWVRPPDLEFQNGSNKAVTYASLCGHAMYPKPGLVLQGRLGIGIRNETAKSKIVMDTGAKFSVVAAEYLGVVEPSWLNYCREWGPKISYDIAEEIKKFEKILPANLKSIFQSFVNVLPNEILGEEGPTGPQMKRNWSGDEV